MKYFIYRDYKEPLVKEISIYDAQSLIEDFANFMIDFKDMKVNEKELEDEMISIFENYLE